MTLPHCQSDCTTPLDHRRPPLAISEAGARVRALDPAGSAMPKRRRRRVSKLRAARAMERRIARFWAKVDRSGGPDACWIWRGCVSGRGYGRLKWGSRVPTRAHRVAYELAFGPIPDGLYVLHRCDVPACVKTEPDARFPNGHLWLGTAQDNTDDMIAKGRQRYVSRSRRAS